MSQFTDRSNETVEVDKDRRGALTAIAGAVSLMLVGGQVAVITGAGAGPYGKGHSTKKEFPCCKSVRFKFWSDHAISTRQWVKQ